MTILSDDMIEAGAKAAYESFAKSMEDTRFSLARYKRPWADLSAAHKEPILRDTRACLEAALPGILERCAKEAEGPVYEERYRGGPGSNWVVDGSSPYGNGRLDAAASIRSLQTKDNGSLATLTPEQREKALSYRGPDGPIGQTKDNA